MKTKYPRIDNIVHNDAVLYLITDPTYLVDSKIPYGFCTTGAVVIPRAKLADFRDVLLNTFENAKYRYSTLYHFKLLSRFCIFGLNERPVPINWDVAMDSYLLKNENIRDLDRKILMPSSWVLSAGHCEKLKFREMALERQVSDLHFENEPMAMGEFKISDFPKFIARD